MLYLQPTTISSISEVQKSYGGGHNSVLFDRFTRLWCCFCFLLSSYVLADRSNAKRKYPRKSLFRPFLFLEGIFRLSEKLFHFTLLAHPSVCASTYLFSSSSTYRLRVCARRSAICFQVQGKLSYSSRRNKDGRRCRWKCLSLVNECEEREEAEQKNTEE